MSDSESQLAEFTDDTGCVIRLTTEKVYAKSIGLEETYALRSLDGVGVFDDINQFAEDKQKLNDRANTWQRWGIICSIIGGFMLIGYISNDEKYLPSLILGGVFGFFGYRLIRNSILLRKTAKLNSYIKLIVSGNNKLYKFNKKESNSSQVADFVNKIEDTLSKYK